MEAIRALQAKLAAAQKGSNVKKISERNCIDLVQKLVQLDLVKLCHTATGKEWLTPDQLDREIRDVLASTGGRLSVTELPHEVGVAIEHCEKATDRLRKKDGALARLHGELLSGQYVQGVAQEIEESLEEVGCLSVADLSTRYNLPAEFVRDTVLGQVGTAGQVVKQNTIYTGAYAARVEARVRGALRGCTQPVALSQIAARHALDTDLVATSVQACINKGSVEGKLQGGTFTPKTYTAAESGRVDSFFSSNGYMPASTAKAAGMSLKEWQKSGAADGVSLTSVFLGTQVVEQALAPILEALSSESFSDVQSLLPPALAASDARELLQHFVSKKQLPATAMVIDTVVMSRQLVKAITDSLAKEAQAAAEQALTSTSSPSKAPKKAAPAAAAAAEDDDDDDWDDKKKKGGKKAPAKGAPAKGKKAKGGGDDDAGGAAGGAGGGASGIDSQVIQDALAERFPEVPVEIYDELCGHLQPLLAKVVEEKKSALQNAMQSKQKAKFDTVEKLVQEKYEELVLGFRALETKSLQDSPLLQHLLRETVAEPLHQLLALRYEEATGTSMEVTAASRKQCLDKLTSIQGAGKVKGLADLLGVFSKKDGKDDKGKEAKDSQRGVFQKKNAKDLKKKKGPESDDDNDKAEAEAPKDVSEIYHAAADECHIFCRKVDKKREKAAVGEQRAARRERLREVVPADAAQVCRIGLQLALLQDGVPGLLFPSEPWALKLIAGRLEDEDAVKEATALCDTLENSEAGGGDAAVLEAASAAWRSRGLGDGAAA